MNSQISIVIPTYNRPNQLSDVLTHILASCIEGFDNIEVIVVDDGSTNSPRMIVENIVPSEPFDLRYIYQENSGPAAARNNGFRSANNEIVLFIDDDILVFPDLVQKHYKAHLKYPRSVIFGQSPYPPMDKPTPAFRYLTYLAAQSLESVGSSTNDQGVKVEIIASGNLSVEKHLFQERDVYSSGLKIPVGEEYELSAYLLKQSIPTFFLPSIKGWHLQPATLSDSCMQNYKYGLGIAELAAKRPDVLALKQARHIFETNSAIRAGDQIAIKIKKRLRTIMSPNAIRTSMLCAVRFAEKFPLPDLILFAAYRLVIGNFFAAGIADGQKRFSQK